MPGIRRSHDAQGVLLVMPAHAPIEAPAELPKCVTVMRRPSDLGWSARRVRWEFVLWGLRVARAARRHAHVMTFHPGVELFVLGALLRRKRVTVVDFLIPRSTLADRLRLIRGFEFRVLRRSDAATLSRRFGIPPHRITFLRCPAPSCSGETGEDSYGYAAGWAHRDWRTLNSAAGLVSIEICAAGEVPSELTALRKLGPLSPDRGRALMRRSRFVVLALLDTELPSGPLVLLDAMAHGKAVVVSDVGGSRDYVTDGVDGLLVPPGDSVALRNAIDRVAADQDLRSRLGAAARRRASEYSSEDFWQELLSPYGYGR